MDQPEQGVSRSVPAGIRPAHGSVVPNNWSLIVPSPSPQKEGGSSYATLRTRAHILSLDVDPLVKEAVKVYPYGRDQSVE